MMLRYTFAKASFCALLLFVDIMSFSRSQGFACV
jgi:hypothetical protein